MMSQQNPSVYIAVLVYESSSSSSDYKALFEESFMLVKATSIEEARQKTQQYADAHTSTFKNEAGDSITWNLKHVVDVNQVLYDVDLDGTEIYARHFRNYQAYKDFEPLLSGEKL
jgi:ABC-type antimicrobial peptide transport system permease subunit